MHWNASNHKYLEAVAFVHLAWLWGRLLAAFVPGFGTTFARGRGACATCRAAFPARKLGDIGLVLANVTARGKAEGSDISRQLDSGLPFLCLRWRFAPLFLS